MKNLNSKKQNHTSHRTLHTSQKGITLIALIITIIVMLILVGVTVSVALNGRLFGKGEKAAFQTGASAVKEQLEIEKALSVMENGGKPLKDYSGITVGSLTGLDAKTIEKYGNMIVVDSNGDICYNPAEVTDEEKTWLEEIGIKASSETNLSDLKKLEKYLKSSVIYDENDITNSLLDITKEPPMFKGRNPITDAETSIEMTNIEFNEDGTIDAWIKYNANSENNNIYIVNCNFEAKENGEPKKITFNSINLKESITIDNEYFLYCRPSGEGGGTGLDYIFIDRNTGEAKTFIGVIGYDVCVPYTFIELSFDADSGIIMAGFGTADKQKYGTIDEDFNLIFEADGTILEPQKLPSETKDFIEIYDTSDATDFSNSGLGVRDDYKKSYGMLEDGKCYHLYKFNEYYMIISTGTVDYTIENGILKVEQIGEGYAGTGEFKEYTIGTEAIKVK